MGSCSSCEDQCTVAFWKQGLVSGLLPGDTDPLCAGPLYRVLTIDVVTRFEQIS